MWVLECTERGWQTLTCTQRDQEYRESIAETLRKLRSESTRQTMALEKLQTRNEDLVRQMSLAQSQERSARAALRTAESSARSLRDEMLRLKTTVQQVRTSCANDVRKRDVQIQKLKGHLTTQQRGNRTGLVGASITINPGVMGLAGSTSGMRNESPDLDDPVYSLKQETTEFLTQLSQSLSDENDNLIGLVRSALVTLKDLQGMPDHNHEADGEGMSAVEDEDEDKDECTRQGMSHALPTNYEALANDMDTVLDNLKNLLTNPNFVAVDEVELREEEIHRLRAGWEKMETRLRESFILMDSWRKRMTNGDTINLEELQKGLGLGAGLERVDSEDISMVEEEEEEEGEEEDGDEEEDIQDEASSVFQEEIDEEEKGDSTSPRGDERPPEVVQAAERTANADMFKLKLQPMPTALRETNGNKSPSRSPRKVAFSASIPNTPSQVEDENIDASGLDLVGVEISMLSPLASKALRSADRGSRSTVQEDRTPRHVRCDKFADQIMEMAGDDAKSDTDQQTRKRHSSPRPHTDEPSPKLTVHDKLAQAKADAAAAAAEALEVSDVVEDTRKRRATRSPTKSRIQGRPKRRKSTLTPEELENLLNC
jgi:hypothetical protein